MLFRKSSAEIFSIRQVGETLNPNYRVMKSSGYCVRVSGELTHCIIETFTELKYQTSKPLALSSLSVAVTADIHVGSCGICIMFM